ncbi:MAG: hypothetical protein J6W81_08525 [Lentisphaeria bacterium]|nr:hypothetical protein [Lentisphaeria bacterium]
MHLNFSPDFQHPTEQLLCAGIEVEHCSMYDHSHANVMDETYAIHSPGNKHLFATAPCAGFSLHTDFCFAPTILVQNNWNIYFGYDPLSETGYGIKFAYSDTYKEVWEGFKHFTLEVQLFKICRQQISILETELMKDFHLSANTWYPAALTLQGNKLQGSCAGRSFSLLLPEAPPAGQVGLGRERAVGEVRFRNTLFQPEEEFTREEQLKELVLTIPAIHGGGIPYRLNVDLDHLRNIHGSFHQLHLLFNGGMWDRKQHECLPGQYCVEIDRFTNPAVEFRYGSQRQKIYLKKNDSLNIADPSFHYEFLSEYNKITREPVALHLPLKGLPENPDPEKIRIIFSYDALQCNGYLSHAAGKSEFVWDGKGKLLYSGEMREQNHHAIPAVRISSSGSTFKKYFRQKNLIEPEQIISHAEKNHYFSLGDTPEFQWKTWIDPEVYDPQYLEVKTTLCDVFRRPLHTLTNEDFVHEQEESWQVLTKRISLGSGKLQHGVHLLKTEMFYAGELLRTDHIVFEVIDPAEKCPAPLASGLPFLYSTANEETLLASDVFDPWHPGMNSNAEHYFSCSCFTPGIGQNKKVWEALRPYKREWYMWLDSRTEKNWDTALFSEAISHVDYISIRNRFSNNRLDLWKPGTYNSPAILSQVREFLEKTPETKQFKHLTIPYVDQLLKTQTSFSLDALEELLSFGDRAWLCFLSQKLKEELIQQTEELEKINPEIKRAQYGPWPVYTAENKTAYFMHAFGIFPDGETSQRIWKGFFQFEDYAFLCSYHTSAPAYGLMSYKLFYPGIKVFPELYDFSGTGCPDGALSYAAPPLGERYAPDYYQIASVYDYAFSTAYYVDGQFNYWKDYGFMFRDPHLQTLENLICAWRHVKDHSPAECVRSIAYIMDIPSADNRFYKNRLLKGYQWPEYVNSSEEALCYLNKCARLSGIPAGFGTRFKELKNLSAAQCSMLVLPSLDNASAEDLQEIQRLHDEGVFLFACGSVAGLEELFSVHKAPALINCFTIRSSDETEKIPAGTGIELRYQPVAAEVLLASGNGDPLLMRHKNTALFNVNPSMIGRDSFMELVKFSRTSISKLLEKTVIGLLRQINQDKVPFHARNAGCSGFTDEHGKSCIVLFDYGSFNDERFVHDPELITVKFQNPAKDVICEDKEVNLMRKDGKIHGFTCRKKPRETIFAEIVY